MIEILDTTLRDGTQGEAVNLSSDDKIAIAKRLAAFGTPIVEGGWPGSNPKDAEFFARMKGVNLGKTQL
ncbi:MAG: citramalate synthase, partial [Thermaceae bacterium]|nr:citramalate synthase [Thermaceae bacterium]